MQLQLKILFEECPKDFGPKLTKIEKYKKQVKTVQVERQTLQEEHDRLMGRQSLLLQELASKEKG